MTTKQSDYDRGWNDALAGIAPKDGASIEYLSGWKGGEAETWEIARGEKDYPLFDDVSGTIEIAAFGEECDCGSHIRHNNGGNYHASYSLRFRPETGKYEEWFDTGGEFGVESLVGVGDDPNLTLQFWSAKEGKGFWFQVYLDDLGQFDYEALRRRTRDALNKTADHGAIVRCAIALGVKLQ